MKKILISSLLIIVIIFLLPYITDGPAEEDVPEQEQPSDFVPFLTGAESEDSTGDFDSACMVPVSIDGSTAEMNMQEYLRGVVAAEMPVQFNTEALKAQAVAARTYTVYKMGLTYPENHPDAAVCDDIACCKAYISESGLRERWGSDYDSNLAKIAAAVSSTDGIVITYESEPILAAFHSSSSGKTAASDEVWGAYLPYLVSVESPESPETVPNYLATVEFPFEEFRSAVSERFPAATLGENPEDWIKIESITSSGRVESVSIGGVSVSGSVARSMFSLRSATFTVTAGESGMIFTTAGYGHGVGMSQYGANILAAGGASFEEILATYYTGTELIELSLG